MLALLGIMKKILLLIIFASSNALSETLWEKYLALPNDLNAEVVEVIEYSEGAIPEGYRYWIPDLLILQNQVNSGSKDSLCLAIRLMLSSDGGLREDLIALIARSIRINPSQFLTVTEQIALSDAVLMRILNMPGLEYVDRLGAQNYELSQRVSALRSVKEPSLLKLVEKYSGMVRLRK
ncbi:hypothetical protein [Reinekea blandensis]|uniref:DUF1400 domain-containing protein n=1 Tax=Reinekea blandensis MED297 TaxID=314283 RepID=A4BKJ6_9GAMM|nr:hypothetical protein [Reinekea blandensis]EAR07349.1 hypothetical protein MED297_07666 [Reinekea sp. MED297] [Reinekea blandensis MED297]